MRILVLEASTSSAKAMVFDAEQGVLSLKSEPYAPDIDDNATQDAEGVLSALVEIGREAAAGHKIDAIALCGAWHSVLVCDGHMQPVTRVFSWQYRGAIQTVRRLLEDEALTREQYKNTGCMVHSIYPVYKLAHLREEGLRMAGKLICGQGSYIYYRLTGMRHTTPCMVSGSAFLNVNTKDYNPLSMEIAGVKKEQLGELCDSRSHAPLREEFAKKLGVPADVPVMAPNSDGALNQVGAQAGMRDMTVSIGTSAALRMNVGDKPVYNPHHSTWTYLSPYAWMLGAATSGACNCVDWFVENFSGGRTYNELAQRDADVEKMPFFLPFLYGERCPGWNDDKLGGFRLVHAEHTVYDLYMSVLEGVLFNVYQCYREIIKFEDAPETILISGGIANSPKWLRMAANIFGRELTLDLTAQTSMLGAAYLALDALNGGQKPPAPQKELIKPDAEKMEICARRYEKYLALYAQC